MLLVRYPGQTDRTELLSSVHPRRQYVSKQTCRRGRPTPVRRNVSLDVTVHAECLVSTRQALRQVQDKPSRRQPPRRTKSRVGEEWCSVGLKPPTSRVLSELESLMRILQLFVASALVVVAQSATCSARACTADGDCEDRC